MINHLLEDPKFWLLVCFIIFVIVMIKPFKKFMIGGLDNKIEEIKRNINLSLESFTIAEKKMSEATSNKFKKRRYAIRSYTLNFI